MTKWIPTLICCLVEFVITRPAFNIQAVVKPEPQPFVISSEGRLNLLRRKAYHDLLSEVERTGVVRIYESKGEAEDGWMLPKGRYLIARRESDGEAGYELLSESVVHVKPLKQRVKQQSEYIPIPVPDKKELNNFVDPLIVFPRDSVGSTEECVGQS